MPPNRRRLARTTRRSFLGSVGVAAAGLGLASRTSAAADGQFVLEQGDECVPLTPLAGAEPVEELYQWGLAEYDWSATGLVDLQRPETSIMFLYDGPNGLSLVLVHDKYQDGTNGGSVTFEFAGLPLDGQWVVQDDFYDGDTNYDRWVRNGDTTTVDWTWGAGRTDGGVFRGLGGVSDLELRITPAFNESAALYDEYYDGELTDWQALSGSLDAPDRTSLTLDEPVVIRRGTCSTDGTGGDGEDGDDETDDEGGDDSDSDDGGDDDSDSGNDGDSQDGDGDSEDDGDGDADETEESEDDDEAEGGGDDNEEGDDGEGDDDDDERRDDDDDEREDEEEDEDGEDDHPGKGRGHERSRGKGHERGNGKGHGRHGDHDDGDEDDEDDHPGKGKKKGKKGKKKGRSGD